jgi:hypothetical protein
MRLYLDEDVASRDLTRALVRAGHDVKTPLDDGLTGESDAAQLTHALRENRVSLTANYGDFEELHDLVILSGGSHPGIFTIRNDNDRRRDIKPGQIAVAIKNLESVLSSVRNQFICLNDWR